jgi:hypothetical protein
VYHSAVLLLVCVLRYCSKKLASTVPLYVEARRKRVDPNQEVSSRQQASILYVQLVSRFDCT